LQASISPRAGIPNLGYMYPKGYICLSEGYIYCATAANCLWETKTVSSS